MNHVYIVKADGSTYGVFSTRELADEYKRNMGTSTYSRGRWETLQYEVDRLVPTGPFKYWDAYLNLDGSVYRTSETFYKTQFNKEDAIMTSRLGAEMAWGQSTTSLDEAIRLAKAKLAMEDRAKWISDSLFVDDYDLPHNV